jgi:hypothetical protein
MKRLMTAAAALALALSTAVSSSAAADTSDAAYSWHVADQLLEDVVGSPPWAIAASDGGDTILLDGTGVLNGADKTASGSGRFQHYDADGDLVAEGTFAAHRLISFHFYGCTDGPGFTICGGLAKLAVTLTPQGTSLEIPATLWIDCLIGDKIPPSAEEGVRLSVKDVINFNHTEHSGLTVFVPE